MTGWEYTRPPANGAIDSLNFTVMAAFDQPEWASQVLDEVRAANKRGDFGILETEVIVRDATGDFHRNDSREVGLGHGVLFGTLVGGQVGLWGGATGVDAGALVGAATGAVKSQLVDVGLSRAQVQELRASMPGNSSVAVILVDATWAEKLGRFRDAAHCHLFRQSLLVQLHDRLSA